MRRSYQWLCELFLRQSLPRARTRLVIVFAFLLIPGATPWCQTPQGQRVLNADRETVIWQSGQDTLRESPMDLQRMLEVFKQVFLPEGLRIGDSVVSLKKIKMSIGEASNERVTLVFEADAQAQQSGLLWSSGQALIVAAGDVWLGSVFAFDAGVTIEGEVIGDVIAFGGDLTIGEAATVRGHVVAIGGVLHQRGDAKIYGQVFAPGGYRRPRVSVSRAWEFEDRRIQWKPAVSYDRVDGLRLGADFTFQKSALTPRLELWGGYALASKTGQFRMDLHQRLFEKTDIEIGGAIFQLTQTDDDSVVGRDENTVFAVLTGSDYRDYYGSDGGELSVGYTYRERGILSLLYRNVDYRWMDAQPTLWHLFRPDHDFRSNFSTRNDSILARSLDGRSSSLLIMLRVAPIENGGHPVGFNGSVDLSVEVAGGLLGGAYDYERLTAEGRGWWDSGRWHHVMLRAFYGVGLHDIPPNRLFYLGGVGTLRGYPQKSLSGDEAFLAQAEYTFTYWENKLGRAGVVLFGDIGRAASGSGFFDVGDIRADIGLGLQFGKALRVDVAKGLDSAKRDIRVSIRLSRPT